jgi:putative membrane protein
MTGEPALPSPGDEPEPTETEPDPRFTLANQRTFLAWSRTSLALIAAGLGIAQLLPPFKGIPWGRRAIGVPLIVLGAVMAIAAYREWTKNQTALRRQLPLPRSVMPLTLGAAIALAGIAAAVVLLLSAGR